jgi:hypothetical protein
MPQWEYTTLNLSEVPRRALDTDLLNGLGRDGWQLVSILGNGRAYLKREIAPAQPTKRRGTTVDPE